MTDLRYPIGKFEHARAVSDQDLALWLTGIEALPADLRRAVSGLDPEQLETPYRPGGWTIAQVVHHLADSHLNSYLRFKLALTEVEPTIKPYEEQLWAELIDNRLVPVGTELDFLELLHEKWTILLRALTREQLSRRFIHPQSGSIELAWNVGFYAWHGRHHLAHITGKIERERWRVGG